MSRPSTYSPSDQYLVEQVLQGDTARFGEIVNRTKGLVTQIVFKLIPHPADRPDLAQDIYLKAFRHLAGFRHQAKLSTWIGQIAYNTCLHYLEKKRLLLPGEPGLEAAETGPGAPALLAVAPEVEARLFGQDLTAVLAAEIDKLPPLYKTLIGLYHQQELSYAEIAHITSLPEGTVKSYLFRARKALKESIEATYQRDEL
ncbi:RNA polymerase sigma factor [Hymenobacter ruricola]|uniref:Sigma-70 family RNA polymerase sigma factor n=1 Tax=Hymenobacter ruricola TaxID=2791023 RepID=A0ABS0I329_9BACT|nr:sigma-70 family RNA polymerase sigma factor [Hymenobacter ruricola]MBF9221349.1 sigma-70 family RNA polymerase sigma factor [Hymenobacter ruricola]